MRTSADKQVKIPAASGRGIDRALTQLLARGLHHEAHDAFNDAGDLVAAKTELLEHQVRLRTEDLERSNRETIRTLIRVTACRDDDSGAHVKRIGLYTTHLAHRMGLDAGYCALISLACQLHDVGKIGVSERLLEKPGALTRAEWKVMRTHAGLGARMLSGNSSPYLMMAAEIAHAHHERWDGSGYPRGLSGAAIPLAARIVCLCDIYDALRTRRPYKQALDHDVALRAILGGDVKTRPHHFDPAVLAAFESGLEGFREIFATVRE